MFVKVTSLRRLSTDILHHPDSLSFSGRIHFWEPSKQQLCTNLISFIGKQESVLELMASKGCDILYHPKQFCLLLEKSGLISPQSNKQNVSTILTAIINHSHKTAGLIKKMTKQVQIRWLKNNSNCITTMKNQEYQSHELVRKSINNWATEFLEHLIKEKRRTIVTTTNKNATKKKFDLLENIFKELDFNDKKNRIIQTTRAKLWYIASSEGGIHYPYEKMRQGKIGHNHDNEGQNQTNKKLLVDFIADDLFSNKKRPQAFIYPAISWKCCLLTILDCKLDWEKLTVLLMYTIRDIIENLDERASCEEDSSSESPDKRRKLSPENWG